MLPVLLVIFQQHCKEFEGCTQLVVVEGEIIFLILRSPSQMSSFAKWLHAYHVGKNMQELSSPSLGQDMEGLICKYTTSISYVPCPLSIS